jgi:hypothetical protein
MIIASVVAAQHSDQVADGLLGDPTRRPFHLNAFFYALHL